MKFAALLRELRRRAGLTQAELADLAQVGERTLRDLEAGRATRPQRSTVDLLATALDLGEADRAEFVASSRGQRSPREVARAAATIAAAALGASAAGRVGPQVNLRPAPSLVGRDDAIPAISALLAAVDLVTLVGLAGVGKTSLGVAVAHSVVDRFPGGVGGVAVTDASLESEVLASVVSTLGAGRADALAAHVSGRPALIFLDGADRAPDAARAALAWLRSHVPSVRVLATSRHPLHVDGEHEWPVAPLEVPPLSASGRDIFEYPAAVLFLERLRRVRHRPVTLAEAPTLAALLRRLGGVPFALELEAARGRVLELGEMLARCVATGPTAEPAGQVLRESIATSWRLLAPGEQECMCWLAVFPWRWSVSLAEVLLAGAPAGSVGGDVVALLDGLVGVGLVSVRPDPHEMRFWMLELVREFALEQAAAAGTMPAIREQHASAMVDAAAVAVAELAHADPTVVLAAASRLDNIAADLHAALDYLREAGDAAVAGQLAADIALWRELRGLSD